MTKKTVYLSGPITGMPENNFKEFELAAKYIADFGFNVINPHEICKDVEPTLFETPEKYWEHCMRLCIAEMAAFADIVVTLHGWEDSKGANIEVRTARLLGFIDVQSAVKFFSING